MADKITNKMKKLEKINKDEFKEFVNSDQQIEPCILLIYACRFAAMQIIKRALYTNVKLFKFMDYYCIDNLSTSIDDKKFFMEILVTLNIRDRRLLKRWLKVAAEWGNVKVFDFLLIYAYNKNAEQKRYLYIPAMMKRVSAVFIDSWYTHYESFIDYYKKSTLNEKLALYRICVENRFNTSLFN